MVNMSIKMTVHKEPSSAIKQADVLAVVWRCMTTSDGHYLSRSPINGPHVAANKELSVVLKVPTAMTCLSANQ